MGREENVSEDTMCDLFAQGMALPGAERVPGWRWAKVFEQCMALCTNDAQVMHVLNFLVLTAVTRGWTET